MLLFYCPCNSVIFYKPIYIKKHLITNKHKKYLLDNEITDNELELEYYDLFCFEI